MTLFYDAAKFAIKKSARAAGFDVRRLSARDLAARRARFAAEEGIVAVLDAGANVGQWGSELREAGYAGTIVSFEPLSAAFAGLQRRVRRDDRWHAYRLGLGDQVGACAINVAANSWSSSFLPMAAMHLAAAPDSRYLTTETVPVTTLREFCARRLREDEDIYLKLDVQGSEMDILRGAGPVFGQIRVLELELSICELYEGQALYREMMTLLEGQGYELVGLEEGFVDVVTGRVLQFNVIYRRGGRPIG